MTEAEWRFSLSPISPLDWLFFDTPAADRKLRLFSVACCRRAQHLLRNTTLLRLLDLSEAFAEGQVAEVTLRSAHREEWQKHHELRPVFMEIPAEVVSAIVAALHAAG